MRFERFFIVAQRALPSFSVVVMLVLVLKINSVGQNMRLSFESLVDLAA